MEAALQVYVALFKLFFLFPTLIFWNKKKLYKGRIFFTPLRWTWLDAAQEKWPFYRRSSGVYISLSSPLSLFRLSRNSFRYKFPLVQVVISILLFKRETIPDTASMCTLTLINSAWLYSFGHIGERMSLSWRYRERKTVFVFINANKSRGALHISRVMSP